MSAHYVMIQWNRQKVIYDLMVVGLVSLYLLTFLSIGMLTHQGSDSISMPILVMRALGTCGVLMLHLILSIGPLTRLSDWFLPLLYNRRHLGVMFFGIVLLHALIATAFYGLFGVENPLFAVLIGTPRFGYAVPFELYGFGALLIFFIMAATSHDFWLANLGSSLWKWLHMGVYLAYGLVVLHVLFGALQSERSSLYPVLVGFGFVWLVVIHGAAALKERSHIRAPAAPGDWVEVGSIGDIPDGGAVVVRGRANDRIAVYRKDDSVWALSNVCAHQGGPLGEGQILEGCITCPWHGYQYKPDSGRSPPPYTERVDTYEVRIEDALVRVHVTPRKREP